AAYVQTLFSMTSGHTYAFKLKWKTNRNAPGTSIYAGAGPVGGHFSPTSLLVQTLASGTTYCAVSTPQYSLQRSADTTSQPRDAAATSSYAAAGPLGGHFSPTSLLVQTLTSGTTPYGAVSTQQYPLSHSDGMTWQPVDAALMVTVTPGADTNSVLGANADLFTNTAGYNQDIGIFVSDNGGADQMLAWKESGG